MHRKILKKAMMGLVVMLCIIAMAVPVFANSQTDYGTGQVEVDNEGGQVTSFKAYKIFNANKNADGTVSNISWSSYAVRNVVLNMIHQFDISYSSMNAQDAADFISDAYTNASGQLATDQTTILNNTEFLNRLAVAMGDTEAADTLTAGVAKTLGEGYWLIVTDGYSVGTDESGTSPIFTIAGGSPITINEKTSVPTVDKVVLNDADGAEWTYGADIQRGQPIVHKVTGTVAGNIKTYGTYYYEFEDLMSAGIDYDMDSYRVTIDGTDVTDSFTQTLTAAGDGTNCLSIASSDILGIAGIKLTGSSEVVLTYMVKLNEKCVVGSAGNPNDVRVIYSSNPNTDEKSTTHTVRDYLYTFGLHFEKKDRDTNMRLKGAKFTIEATGPDDAASKGLFVQADGRLGKTPYEFTTDEEGCFNINGLDAGTYTLHETQCPEMYRAVNKDTVFTISATYKGNGMIESLTNTVSGNADACAGTDTTDDNTVNGDLGTAVSVNNCLVNVTVGNIEKIKMPLSGGNGFFLIAGIGVGIVVISAAGFLLARAKQTKVNG